MCLQACCNCLIMHTRLYILVSILSCSTFKQYDRVVYMVELVSSVHYMNSYHHETVGGFLLLSDPWVTKETHVALTISLKASLMTAQWTFYHVLSELSGCDHLESQGCLALIVVARYYHCSGVYME